MTNFIWLTKSSDNLTYYSKTCVYGHLNPAIGQYKCLAMLYNYHYIYMLPFVAHSL